ncbi:MAG: CRTAC1 family protein [Myxococcota bacterium]
MANGVTFTDIASETIGVTYRRGASEVDALFEAERNEPTYDFADLVFDTPYNSRGMPGVALLDFDDDGDIDIYVTNGPGVKNSLYSNQLIEKGEVSFIDVAAAAGVAATSHDSSGVCFGDIDNDGDHDLFVLSSWDVNRLFENQGDGTFTDISQASGIGATLTYSASCALGDVDNDGLLDIAIANTFFMVNHEAILSEVFAKNEPNQLFMNQGGNVFVDVSAPSGITEFQVPSALPSNAAGVSWAVGLVDYDQDGDVDAFFADDQGSIPWERNGGFDRATNQLHVNDGTGVFSNVTLASQLGKPGDWMGLSFGDFNRDGRLDFFSSNLGNYSLDYLFGPQLFADMNEPRDSRWFLQNADGTFTDANDIEGDLHTPFGWGTSAGDYDNDGDTDIIFHGGIEFGFYQVTTPGVILENDGAAHFTRDTAALADSTDHVRRMVYGVAIGDLDNDGFIDIVSASAYDYPEPSPLQQVGPLNSDEFDADAFIVPTFTPVDPTIPPAFSDHVFAGIREVKGTLSIEMNSANNGNKWVQVDVMGTIGLTSKGGVNRDGIGAVVKFTPRGDKPVLQPILGGSSHLSQDSLIAHFGLGSARRGQVEVLWPGGVRNRLYNVRSSERIVMPEIPCSIDDRSIIFRKYRRCVKKALGEMLAAKIIGRKHERRLMASALRAWRDERRK